MATTTTLRNLIIQPMSDRGSQLAVWAQDVIVSGLPTKLMYYKVFDSHPVWDFTNGTQIIRQINTGTQQAPVNVNIPVLGLPREFTYNKNGELLLWFTSLEGITNAPLITDQTDVTLNTWEPTAFRVYTAPNGSPTNVQFDPITVNTIGVTGANTTIPTEKTPIIEVLTDVNNGYGAATGPSTLVAEFNHDSTGNIVLDASGRKSITQDGSGNRHIGRLVLPFQPNAFGPGIHAFGLSSSTPPFTVTLTLNYTSGNPIATGATVRVIPGNVNQVVPTNMFTPAITLSSPLALTYVWLVITTGGSQFQNVTSVTILAGDPSTYNPALNNATAGAAPSYFVYLLAAIVGNGTTFESMAVTQINSGNVTAFPQQVFILGKSTPPPGAEPFDRYWIWATLQTGPLNY